MRNIDLSQPLSYEDFVYLRDRERLPKGTPRSWEDYEATLDGAAEGDTYDDMSVAALRNEAKSRNLSATGTKAELVARLEADDEESEDDDDDE